MMESEANFAVARDENKAYFLVKRNPHSQNYEDWLEVVSENPEQALPPEGRLELLREEHTEVSSWFKSENQARKELDTILALDSQCISLSLGAWHDYQVDYAQLLSGIFQSKGKEWGKALLHLTQMKNSAALEQAVEELLQKNEVRTDERLWKSLDGLLDQPEYLYTAHVTSTGEVGTVTFSVDDDLKVTFPAEDDLLKKLIEALTMTPEKLREFDDWFEQQVKLDDI